MNGRFQRLLHLEVRYALLVINVWTNLTGADMKFVLLHEGKNDDGIRQFFMDVWELYVKVRTYNNDRRSADLRNKDDDEPFPHRSYNNSK